MEPIHPDSCHAIVPQKVRIPEGAILERVRAIIAGTDVVLFMKGLPHAPQCGFSAAAAQILRDLGVPFKGIDVLGDWDLREGVKAHSSWPTLPQLYVKGEFIGGCDIMREMAQSGELATLFRRRGIAVAA
ncbi:MAG: Grx4 family monothiol glutaredoxin [Telmatospirillum sp.]|nr:Grx4 family monothiol glutaredoxin [Telmatospirillum sp.]